MVSEAIFRDALIEHSQHPRCHRPLDHPTHQATGDNPLCGDKIRVELTLGPEGTIDEVGITCVGCAISTASASLMASRLSGLNADQARQLIDRVHRMVVDGEEPLDPDQWGELSALSVVRRYPMRVKCATLAWHALRHALEGVGETVTTE